MDDSTSAQYEIVAVVERIALSMHELRAAEM